MGWCVCYEEMGGEMELLGGGCKVGKGLVVGMKGGGCEKRGRVMVKEIGGLRGDVLKFEEVVGKYKKVVKEMGGV